MKKPFILKYFVVYAVPKNNMPSAMCQSLGQRTSVDRVFPLIPQRWRIHFKYIFISLI